MGGDWRMPTKEDLEELKNNTTKTDETLNGIAGYRLTSKINGNSIFVPKTGDYYGNDKQDINGFCGVSASKYDATRAYYMYVSTSVGVYDAPKANGLTIRPVQ